MASSKKPTVAISPLAKSREQKKPKSTCGAPLTMVVPASRKRTRLDREKDSENVKRPCQRNRTVSQREWPMFRFYPVDSEGQRELCSQLGLQYCLPNRFGRGGPNRVLTYPNIATVRSIVGDGNCLFRAFSLIITGSQEQHMEIRQIIITHMYTLAPFLLGLHITQHNSIQSYISQERMDEDYAWGSEVEILTLSHLLQTNIYSFDITSQRWFCYSPHYVDRSIPLDVSKKSLYLIHYPRHFAVVSSVEH